MEHFVRRGWQGGVAVLALAVLTVACGKQGEKQLAAYRKAVPAPTQGLMAAAKAYFALTCEDTIPPEKAAQFEGLLVSAPEQINRLLHDCQKLMLGRDRYGPLVGLEVGDSIDDRVQHADSGVVLADIPDFDQNLGYPDLNIQPKPIMNCLWVKGDPNDPVHWEAAVRQGATCADTSYLRMVGPTLTVHVIPYQRPGPHASTARWGWDGKTQFIGISCGLNRWCEMGPKNFHGSGATNADDIGLADDQYLAVNDTAAPGTVRPSYVRGRIQPYDTLAHIDADQLENGNPVKAARIVLMNDGDDPANSPASSNARVKAHYRGRYKLVGDTTDLYLWHKDGQFQVGTTPTWDTLHWSAMTRCSWPHASVGAVRWRWSAKDEAIWMACANGCCNATQIGQ